MARVTGSDDVLVDVARRLATAGCVAAEAEEVELVTEAPDARR